MVNGIEQGRNQLRITEAVKASSRELFTSAIELVNSNRDITKKNHLIFRRPVVKYVVTSSIPNVHVWVEAHANADSKKTRRVSVWIQGKGQFIVDKGSTLGGEDVFWRKEISNGSFFPHEVKDRTSEDLDTVNSYLNAIKQVKRELFLAKLAK